MTVVLLIKVDPLVTVYFLCFVVVIIFVTGTDTMDSCVVTCVIVLILSRNEVAVLTLVVVTWRRLTRVDTFVLVTMSVCSIVVGTGTDSVTTLMTVCELVTVAVLARLCLVVVSVLVCVLVIFRCLYMVAVFVVVITACVVIVDKTVTGVVLVKVNVMVLSLTVVNVTRLCFIDVAVVVIGVVRTTTDVTVCCFTRIFVDTDVTVLD